MAYFTFTRRFTSGLLSGIVSTDVMEFYNLQSAQDWALSINERPRLDYKVSNLALAYDGTENSPIKFSLLPLDDNDAYDLRVEYPQVYDDITVNQLAKKYVIQHVNGYICRECVADCPATIEHPTKVRFYELHKLTY